MPVITIFRSKRTCSFEPIIDVDREELKVNVPDATLHKTLAGGMVIKCPAIPGHFLSAAEVADLATRQQRGFSLVTRATAA